MSRDEPDREMRCVDCGMRMFSSRAPELAPALDCPRCRGQLALVPLPAHKYSYPRVVSLPRQPYGS